MKLAAVWFVGLFCVIASAGCSVIPGLPYTAVVYDYHSDPDTYILLEHGAEKRLYSSTANVVAYFTLLPFRPVEGSKMEERLFGHPVQWWEFGAGYEMALGSRKRVVMRLQELARLCSPAPFWVGDEKQETAPKRWILANEPLVIAVGTDAGPIEWYGNRSTYSLIRESDAERTATELIVLDKWPPPWNNTGTGFERDFESKLGKVVRRIKFEQPQTLREILSHRMWQQTGG